MAPAQSGLRPRALVYRHPTDEDQQELSDAVGRLLESSPRRFQVQYAGPGHITSETLNTVDLYAQPGGPDLETAWEENKVHAKAIKDFVHRGGRYLGFCLGAYLAGHTPGYGLLPSRADTDSEREKQGAEVKHDKDAVIKIDWNFSTGPHAGRILQDQQIYFQEGAVITGFDDSDDAIVLARYSKSGRVAASLNRHGNGWVGLTGPHPEAPDQWFRMYKLKSDHGERFDIGHDLIEAVMTGGRNVNQCRRANWPAKLTDSKKSRNPFRKIVSGLTS